MTIDTLNKSIIHWEDNLAQNSFDGIAIGSEDCALCQEYDGCVGCPIALYIQEDGCRGTPYENCAWAYDDGNIKEFKIYAKKMLELLELLRDKEIIKLTESEEKVKDIL